MDHQKQVHLALDLTDHYLEKKANHSTSPQASTSVKWTHLTQPSSWSGFSCLAINLVGNGIASATSSPSSSTYLSGVLSGSSCSYLGLTSSPISLSSVSALVLSYTPQENEYIFKLL
jgi:hypothetical protein